ncbi:hypothetical protein EYF80_027336 [Liparis tanakae]|uniref:Uncharacterized protein n=1 Tax=Liparis tanakae TaxID=230148 RepID=A0A4Z2H968_9TELE|nr:hypothetical protein EYF80_027336 [Liparis tanakae]
MSAALGHLSPDELFCQWRSASQLPRLLPPPDSQGTQIPARVSHSVFVIKTKSTVDPRRGRGSSVASMQGPVFMSLVAPDNLLPGPVLLPQGTQDVVVFQPVP